jgi:Family of unknown function (DUF6390)
MTALEDVSAGAVPVTNSGATLFARFAYPPNVLGFCGPADHRSVLEHAANGVVDGGLRQLARQFTGAWPYLELLAGVAGVADPLDPAVVEAYWVGSSLLDTVTPADLGGSLDGRFRHRLGREWGPLAELVSAGARPHHNFHVFGVYPWVGLLRSGSVDEPLRVLDRCRVRWGRVMGSAAPGRLLVRSRSLVWDGARLGLGVASVEEATVSTEGQALTCAAPGDWVALHWDWVCHRLSRRQVGVLRRVTLGQLAVVNGASHPGPAALLG